MNAISSIKSTWQRPAIRRFQASEEIKAELLAQDKLRRRAALDRR